MGDGLLSAFAEDHGFTRGAPIVGRIRHLSAFIIPEGCREGLDPIVANVIFGKPGLCPGNRRRNDSSGLGDAGMSEVAMAGVHAGIIMAVEFAPAAKVC